MAKTIVFIAALFLVFTSVCHADFLDKAKAFKNQVSGSAEPDKATTIAGLKEALTVGTGNAVKLVSQADGYFGNPAIKIPVPEKIQKLTKLMKKVGMKREVDAFEKSMNQAAEKAAPRAKDIFVSAVKEMTFGDAFKILRGNDTAATDYLKSKTSGRMFVAFKPIVASAMNDVGVTRLYKQLTAKATVLPISHDESLDLDHYVTSKALEGLFYMVGQEEKKIRKDPAARVTELLKKVFKK